MSYRLTADVLVVLHLAYILIRGHRWPIRFALAVDRLDSSPGCGMGHTDRNHGMDLSAHALGGQVTHRCRRSRLRRQLHRALSDPCDLSHRVDARTAAQLRYDRPLHQCSRLRHHRQSLDYEIVALTTHSHPARPVIRSSGYGRD